MSYIDGYLIPVPADKIDRYLDMAKEMASRFREWGATRIVETVEDDCPAGKLNDFHSAVMAEPGEKTVFSWIEWPSKEARESGMAKMHAHFENSPGPSEMPFDGKRMIFGGFAPILDA